MRVNVENDWLINDILLCSCYFVCKYVDLVSDLLEIKELLAWNFFKDSPRLSFIMQVIQSEF